MFLSVNDTTQSYGPLHVVPRHAQAKISRPVDLLNALGVMGSTPESRETGTELTIPLTIRPPAGPRTRIA
jgi:hypothetical protein